MILLIKGKSAGAQWVKQSAYVIGKITLVIYQKSAQGILQWIHIPKEEAPQFQAWELKYSTNKQYYLVSTLSPK